MFSGIHTVIFYVSDIDKSKLFYQELGFNVKNDQKEYVSLYLSSDNCVLFALNSMKKHRSKVGSQAIILKCMNIDKTYKKLKNKVNITTKLVKKPWGKTFIFSDPDSNKIEVLEK